MDVEPHAVAGGMAEALAVAGRRDDRAGRGVDVGGRDAGADRVHRRQLRLEADRVEVGERGRRRAGGERARAVRRVAGEHAAEVDGDQRVRADHVVARVRVRLGAALVRGHDRLEREAVGAAPRGTAPARARRRRSRCGRSGPRPRSARRPARSARPRRARPRPRPRPSRSAAARRGRRPERGPRGPRPGSVALDGELGGLESDPARAAREAAQPLGGGADHVALGELDVDPLAQRLGAPSGTGSRSGGWPCPAP